MSDMKCEECVLKHLSTALSFGKEIMSGHDETNELDHRIDFLGEISNAEQHLELIDENLFNEITIFRKNIQAKDIKVNAEDLLFIRSLFRKVELVKNKESYSTNQYVYYSSPLDVVYIGVKNIDNFDLSYKMLIKNLVNYRKIFVVDTELDFSQYDVEKVNSNIFEFMKRDDLSEDVIFMNENMSFINAFDAKKIFPSYLSNAKKIKEIRLEMPNKYGRIYNFENVKPQPINVEEFNKIITEPYQNYTSVYFNMREEEKYANDTMVTVEVIKPVCCSVKQGLKTKKFVRWNENGLESLKSSTGLYKNK